MKLLLKSLAAVAALAFAGTASAQQQIVITGSTAFRGEAHDGILALLDNPTYAYVGSDLKGASQAIFRGTLGGTPLVIKTGWSGSITGLVNVLQSNNNVAVLPDSTTTTGPGNSGRTAGTTTAVPDFAFSDVSFRSTPFTSPTLQERPVGVIPFQYVVSFSGASTSLTNMTAQLARLILTNGFAPLAFGTGLAADRTTTFPSAFATNTFGTAVPHLLYALGRDAGSGTRFLTLAETGFGVNNRPQQYEAILNSNGTSVDNQRLFVTPPPGTVNGIAYAPGEGGYSSGGTLRGIMRRSTLAGISGSYVTVLGINDAEDVADTTATGGAGAGKILTYEGVPFSRVNVQEGRYTLWSFQQVINRTGLPAIVQNFVDALSTEIRQADPIFNGIRVQRSFDGGPVTPNYL